MTKLKTTFGLCAVLATALCVFGPQSASALKAYTCAPVTPGSIGHWEDAHCKTQQDTLNGFEKVGSHHWSHSGVA
jgi:hypothetical protein